LVDASEVLAAFIKAGRSGIVAPDILLEAAKKALHAHHHLDVFVAQQPRDAPGIFALVSV
jgi:phosphoglycerate dehydrogenase-like enzyme